MHSNLNRVALTGHAQCLTNLSEFLRVIWEKDFKIDVCDLEHFEVGSITRDAIYMDV